MTLGSHAELRRITAEHQGLFTRRHARACGFSDDQIRLRIRRGDWCQVFGPVLAPVGLRLTPWLRDVAAQLAIPGGVLSGPSAARRYGFDPVGAESCLVVSRNHHARLPGVRLLREQLHFKDVGLVNGLYTVSRPRAVFDCLRLCDDREAVRFLDRALLLGWTDVDDLVRRVREHVGRHGAPRLARLVNGVAGGARSAAERLLPGILRSAGICGWRANFRVTDSAGLIGIVDLAFPEARLAVEVDGWAYHHTPDRFQRDRQRQNRLVAAGWTVLRFTWRDLTERPDLVARTIGDVLARAN